MPPLSTGRPPLATSKRAKKGGGGGSIGGGGGGGGGGGRGVNANARPTTNFPLERAVDNGGLKVNGNARSTSNFPLPLQGQLERHIEPLPLQGVLERQIDRQLPPPPSALGRHPRMSNNSSSSIATHMHTDHANSHDGYDIQELLTQQRQQLPPPPTQQQQQQRSPAAVQPWQWEWLQWPERVGIDA
jgi:hypothetical protein